MTKKYSPVKVRNPVSSQHIVKLHPTQGFELVFAPWYDISDFDLRSEFLRIDDHIENNDGSQVIKFSQMFDLGHWANISNFVLGEVLLASNYNANLCAVLCTDNPNKQDLITVCNPTGLDLKFEPNQIIEVVIFDEKVGIQALWDCHIECGDLGFQVEQIGREIYRPYTLTPNNVDDVYHVCPRVMNTVCCTQQHFWFRCDSSTISNITNGGYGSFSGGRLIFSAHDFEKRRHIHRELNLHISYKSPKQIHQALLCPKKQENGLIKLRKPLLLKQNPAVVVMKTKLIRKDGGFES